MDYDYEYEYKYLYFPPSTTEKQCFSIQTTEDTNAGEENLEFFYVDWYDFTSGVDSLFLHNKDGIDDESQSVVAIQDDDGIC